MKLKILGIAMLTSSAIIQADGFTCDRCIDANDLAFSIIEDDIAVSTDIDYLLQTVQELQNQITALELYHGVRPPQEGLIAGTYSGGSCTMTGSGMIDGRDEWFFECYAGTGWFLTAHFVTGDIVGHPYEEYLMDMGVDQIVGWENAVWGQIHSVRHHGWAGCIPESAQHGLLSVQQIGDGLYFKYYGTDNIIDCSFSSSFVE